MSFSHFCPLGTARLFEEERKQSDVSETDAVTVAGGFVHPDCFLDVIHTGLDDQQNSVTTVILQDIHVLAEDRIIQAVQDKPGTVPATVTLEVNPYQALELAKAKEAGGKIIPVQGSGSCFPPSMRRPPLAVKSRPSGKNAAQFTQPWCPENMRTLSLVYPPPFTICSFINSDSPRRARLQGEAVDAISRFDNFNPS